MARPRSLPMLLALALAIAAAGRAGEPTIPELEAKLRSATGTERVAVLLGLAEVTRSSSTERSVEYGEEALRLARQLGDRRGEARALNTLAEAHEMAGRHREALRFGRGALAIFEELGASEATARALDNLGTIHRGLGEYDRALDLLTRALEIKRARGNQTEVASTLASLGSVYYDRGEYEQAIDCHRRALAANQIAGDRHAQASDLNNLGRVYLELGDYQAALDYLLRAVALYDEFGDRKGAASALFNAGSVAFNTGQLDRARESFQRALEVYGEVGYRQGVAGSHLNLGNVARVRDRYEEAIGHYRQAYEVGKETGNPVLVAMALDSLGGALRLVGNNEEALLRHREALALRERIGDRRGIATSCTNLGLVYGELGRYDEAARAIARGFGIASAIGSKQAERDLCDSLAGVEEARGRYREALDAYRRYVEIKDSLVNKETTRQIAQMQARYEATRKEKEIALLQQEKELERLRGSRARLAAVLGLVAVVAVLAAAAFLLRKYLYLLAFWRRRSTIGRYRLHRVIAEGGMGVVYRAADLASGSRELALKVIREEYCDDPVLRRRFIHEAAIVDQLDHPNIVRTFERGEHDGRLYIAMELLEGPSLAQVIARGERLPLALCLRVAAQLEDALATIHGKGILHRDLKPGNIVLLDGEGGPRVKLLDFGLATSQAVTRMTETGIIVGTIGYLAPERISEQVCTAASDLYALGVILYEALTLKRPFPGETPAEVIRQILEGQPVPPSAHRSDLPPELDALVARMMAHEATERPSHEELHGVIVALLEQLPGELATAPTAVVASPAPDADSWSTGATMPR